MNDAHRSARHIVIRKASPNDPNDAIQPISLEPFASVASNLLGARIEKQGLIATFPMSAFREGLAFYLIYEDAPLTKDNFEFRITRDMIRQTVK